MPDPTPQIHFTPAEIYEKTVVELFEFNRRFFNDMIKMKKVLTPEVRAALSSEELRDLEILLAPLHKFKNFLVRKPGASEKDTVTEILDQFQSPAFHANKSLFIEVRSNSVALNAFLVRLTERGVNRDLIKLLRDNFISPIQTFNRYEAHMKVIRDAYAKYQGVKLEDLKKYMANEATNKSGSPLMFFTKFLHEYPNSDVRTLIKLEKILNLNMAHQKEFDAVPDFDLFKLPAKERKQMHKALIEENQRAALNSMTVQLLQLGKLMADDKPSVNEKLQTIMMTFCDTYVDERSKDSFTGGTKRSDFLENILKNIITVFQIDLSGSKKPDEAVFEYAGKNPQVCKALVTHLYERAISEGLTGVKDKSVFINSVKAIVRMGNDAIKTWNELAAKNSQQENNALVLPLNTTKNGKVSRFGESDAKALYANLEKKLSKEQFSRFQPSLLVDWVSHAIQPGNMSADQYNKFKTIVEDMQRAGRSKDPTEIHKVFMLAYFDTYITERTKSAGHSQPGILQTFLESLATDGGKHSDTALFDTVPKHSPEAMNLAMKAMALAVTDIQNQAQFVNILKAVKRMGIESEWNNLVSVDYKGLVLTSKMDLSENGIEKLWQRVKDNLNVPVSPSRNAQPSVSTAIDNFGLMGRGTDHSPHSKDSPEPKSPPSPSSKK